MDIKRRVSTVLPIIDDIAEGLSTLHRADLFHLDLKPSNILVQEKGHKINAALGDLGFLNSQEIRLSHIPTDNRNLPLGTRHYRSPEQKDYFDIADAKVEVKGRKVSLVVRDPKFQDTIIDEEDKVFFSKYNSFFEIRDIKYGESTNNSPTVVTINIPTSGIRIENDERTQLIFYKSQKRRTDLFGFGSIVFDLVTCGKSPERFYENIRRYDSRKMSVEKIMIFYNQVANFQSPDPGLIQVFEPFKLQTNPTSYAPHHIVELILKCMLYRVEGTFYQENESMMDTILKCVRLLYNSSDSPARLPENNCLWEKKLDQGSTSSSDPFPEQLKAIRQNLGKEEIPKRLILGLWYFEKVIDLAKNSLDDDFFSELRPQNIEIAKGKDEKSRVKYVTYKESDAFEKDLETDSVYTKISRYAGDPYVPDFLLSMRREIELNKIKFDQSQQGIECKYFFSDPSFYGDKIEAGDWIILKLPNHSTKELLKIQTVTTSNILSCVSATSPSESFLTALADLDSQKESVSKGPISAIFHKKMAPSIYYFQMLGIYLYNLFFVGIENNSTSPPQTVNTIKTLDASLIEFHLKAGAIHNPLKQKEKKLKGILAQLSHIYLKLTFCNSPDSFFNLGKKRMEDNEGNEASEVLIPLRDEVSKLRREIADLLDIHEVQIESCVKKNAFPKTSIDMERVQIDLNQIIQERILVKYKSRDASMLDWAFRPIP